MTATYDASLREFYADLGFTATSTIEGTATDRTAADRLRGVRPLPAGADGREGGNRG